MSGEWKPRSAKGEPYRSRKVLHEANTSIEYGEKTWTTAQTVRDLMQNHLDAETDRYYQQVAAAIFDEKTLKEYFALDKKSPEYKKAEEFLHAAFMFAKHVEDMTSDARAYSEIHLQKLSAGLAVNESVKKGASFAPSLLLEAVRGVSEERPLVSYEVYDAKTGASVGWIPHDAFSTEALYRTKGKEGFRYQITGMKIADHGSGFDSQLSALYLSSKIGKKHLRGKFGEGTKMSELHLLRGGASMKMRSAYTARNGDEIVRSRVWQARPQVKEGRLVSSGVEVEREGVQETGSSVSISLRGAKDAFKKEVLENIDPRIGGLEKNIADFRAQGFSYPMPTSEKHLVGIDVTGDGDVQYVQGLRVELAMESFGYAKPWFSYNFLDSSIIGGRDRNEIKAEIKERIRAFWHHIDDPALLQTLVRTAVHDKKRNTDIGSSEELRALKEILSASGDSRETFALKAQKIVDEALVRELHLKEGVHTLVVPASYQDNRNLADVMSYAESRGHAITVTAASLGSYELEGFGKRVQPKYTIVDIADIRKEMNGERKAGEEQRVEGEKEKAIREVFLAAEASVNALMQKAGMRPKTFEFAFDLENAHAQKRHRSGPLWGDISPILMLWDGRVRINPDGVSDPRHSDPRALQRQIEIYLLSAYAGLGYDGLKREDTLKRSQQFLDTLITQFIPEDAPVLRAIPKNLDYEKDISVLLRLLDSLQKDVGKEREEKKQLYEMYRKALDVRLTLEEAKKLPESLPGSGSYTIGDLIKRRVFVQNGTVSYYSQTERVWETIHLDSKKPVTDWNGLPVYALKDGRYFVHAPMQKGAVLARGEGKKREYTFSDGENFLHIGAYDVDFGTYKTRYMPDEVVAHPGGFTVLRMDRSSQGNGVSPEAHIKNQLAEYTYYPTGTARREGKITQGISTTAIPIEYGQDEWDNTQFAYFRISSKTTLMRLKMDAA